LCLLAVGWVSLLAAGARWQLDYEASPGTSGHSPLQWPTQSTIRRQPGDFTLLLFVHPRCPCSRASVTELAWILARHADQLNAHVVFCNPAGAPAGWDNTDLWREAAALPGAQLLSDQAGRETFRFRAETSGYTLLYDTRGHLVFRGGIAAARGHTGDNAGRRALADCLCTPSQGLRETSVFGCPLFDQSSPCCTRGDECNP
jgi:hypothetical protein